MSLTSRRRSSWWRPLVLALLIAYLCFIAWVVLWPSSAPATNTVHGVYVFVERVHLNFSWVTSARIEFALNTLLVVPVPFLASLLWPSPSWQGWTAYGFVVSGTVELAQALFLPDRTPAMSDVVSNTLGALLGGVAGALVRPLARRGERTTLPAGE